MEREKMEHDHAMGGGGDQKDDLGSLVLAQFQHSARRKDHQLCAVVGTMVQELRDHGLPLTPVAYFGAAASTLDRLAVDPSCGADPTLKALLTFFSMVVPAVSPAVIRSKGGLVGATLTRILGFGTASEGVVKAALKCLACLIVEGDTGNWLSVGPLYGVLLGFVTDKREKVRMQVHHCLRDVLGSFQGTPVLSHASEGITSTFERFLLLAGGSNTDGTTTVQGGGVWEVLFILNALKESLPLLSNKYRTKILKYCKSLLELQQTVVTRAIMEILHAFCCSNTTEVPAEVLLDILCYFASAAGDTEKSADAMASTARLLHVGTKKVYGVNRSICVVKLPAVFSALGDILASEHEEAIFAAAEAFKGLVNLCIDDSLIKQGIDQINLISERGTRRSGPTIIEKICATMEGLLSYRYSAVWDISFQVISALFDKLEESSSYLMDGTIKSLANLEKLSDEDLAFRKQLHMCVGSAICAMGPEMFLKSLPLNLEFEELSKANVWLLPILKQYIVGAKLSFFADSIINMILFMKGRSQKFEREGLVVSARSAQGIVYSLWSLLPAFCNYPPDTSSSFRALKNILCDALSKEPDMRGLICSGLQILIQQNKKALAEQNEVEFPISDLVQKRKDCYTPQHAQENLNAIGYFASDFFKILSEIFLNSANDNGGCLQSTIREFASISDMEAVRSFFKNIMRMLLKVTKQAINANHDRNSNSMQTENSQSANALSVKRALLLDLAVSLLPGLGIEEIDLLYSCIKPGIQDEEAVIQKKAYKTLSIILKERKDFLSSKLDDLLVLVLEALPSCHFSAKRHRLDSLYFLIVHVSKDQSEQKKPEIISSFLTETILALKEGNKKTRNRAYDLLVQIGHACGDEKQGGKKENLKHFFNMVAGGLAGETPHMISAAIKGLARLAYEFSDLIGTAYTLLPSAFLLFQRKNREICKANLGFVKVLVAKSQTDWLNAHLKSIVDGLLKWQDDTKNHFKAKVKALLEMLVQKCGLDAVKAAMPEEHMKLLTNIRKTAERKERKAKSERDSQSLHSRISGKTSTSRISRWNHTNIFSDVEDEDEDGIDDTVYMDSKTAVGALSKMSSALSSKNNSLRSKRLRKSSKSLPGDLLDQMEHDPLDLLDSQKTRSALKSSAHLNQKSETDSDDLEINIDGRIVIHEDGKKVKREKRHSSDNDIDARSNALSHATARSMQKKRLKTDSGWAYTGSEYTSKKASGDLKKKNKLEPYAYWPLDRKLLNRREENKAIARKGMASVVKITKRLEGKSAAAALSVKGLKLRKAQRKKGAKKHK